VPARYLIGIDLGTTNSAVAYVDTKAADPRVRIFEVPQLVAPGEVAPRRQLPSFVYLAGEHDLAPHETALPWPVAAGETRVVVGELARAQGARMASRMIASAKSWLCHPGVDRQAAILPWGESDGPKLSPIASSAAVLGHIRAAWDHVHAGEADARFAEQDVVVTVPASFDEAARELTLEAARRAGYPPIVLVEEPQAAFYAWLDQATSRGNLAAGDRVLVFDVGGGTTDFTTIAVDASGEAFERTAVGDHLLLGGDNIDLTLAKIVEQRLVAKAGKKLDALQWHGLVHACRLAKEVLLGDEPPASAPITVTARGAKLLGGTLRDEITRAELDAVLLDGFFPVVARDAQLVRARGGLQEFGLPYASDPAVTRHLAAFLARHASTGLGAGGGGAVDAVLFNGGAMTPAVLRRRVLDQIAAWQGAAPRELAAVTPELAVAQGAAYYGLVRRGQATRIKGGTPRAFYVGVDTDDKDKTKAVCLAPKGLDDGSRVQLDRDFVLVTNRPVSFKLYSSSSRLDVPGAIVPVGDGRPEEIAGGGGGPTGFAGGAGAVSPRGIGSDLLELPPIVSVLRARGRGHVTVRIEVHITELGALELHCVDRAPPPGALPGDTRWKLGFDMRSGGAAPAAESSTEAQPHPRTDEARAAVKAAFTGGTDRLATIARDLEGMLEARRDEWSMLTNRALFDALADVASERRRSADHEQRWLNLAGFCLRPGIGAPLDAWRARQMWGVFNEGLAHPKSEPGRLAWWITWRRIAGGMSNGQQEQIYDRIAVLVLPNPKQAKKLTDAKASKQELAEMWRAVASMERLSPASKMKLGDELMRRMEPAKGREDALHVWALGRLGARVPLYGPLNAVVPASKAREWIGQLLAWSWPEPDKVAFPLAQLGRRTGDRARDIDDDLRATLAAAVRAMPGGERAAVLVEQVVALEAREERVAFGDTLPAGLRLVIDDDRPDEVAADSADAE
jgi:molecular chaperone DnaK (HSP70)